MTRCEWKIWYDDGSTYRDLDGPPENAPAWGVQVVTMFDAKIGRNVQSRKDFYLWRHGGWWGSDYIGMIDYLQRPGWKKVLFGRTIETEDFADIYRAANYDCEDLPYRKPEP